MQITKVRLRTGCRQRRGKVGTAFKRKVETNGGGGNLEKGGERSKKKKRSSPLPWAKPIKLHGTSEFWTGTLVKLDEALRQEGKEKE